MQSASNMSATVTGYPTHTVLTCWFYAVGYIWQGTLHGMDESAKSPRKPPWCRCNADLLARRQPSVRLLLRVSGTASKCEPVEKSCEPTSDDKPPPPSSSGVVSNEPIRRRSGCCLDDEQI